MSSRANEAASQEQCEVQQQCNLSFHSPSSKVRQPRSDGSDMSRGGTVTVGRRMPRLELPVRRPRGNPESGRVDVVGEIKGDGGGLAVVTPEGKKCEKSLV